MCQGKQETLAEQNRELRIAQVKGPPGDLLCGRFWRWMLLVCQLFTRDSHDLKADVPNLAVKTKQRTLTFSYAPVSAPIHRFLVGKWFGGTCNAFFKLMPTKGPKAARRDRDENNSDHPHTPYLQKICPQNMPYNGGLYGIKVG